MRVCLLEDDVAIQEMLLLVLQDEGYSVINFSNAQACLDALCVTKQDVSPISIDLMIADWRLNDKLNGIEVIQQLRQFEHLRSLPIILMTAATFSNIEELQNLHIALLEKPFSVDDITTLIKQLVEA